MRHLIFFITIAVVCSFTQLSKSEYLNEDAASLRNPPHSARLLKRFAQAGCNLRKGEPASTQCLEAPGTCRKVRECKTITTLIFCSEEEIELYSTEYANEMLSAEFIEEDDWESSKEFAKKILMENNSMQ